MRLARAFAVLTFATAGTIRRIANPDRDFHVARTRVKPAWWGVTSPFADTTATLVSLVVHVAGVDGPLEIDVPTESRSVAKNCA